MEIKQHYVDIKKENIKDFFDEKAVYGLIKRVAGRKYCDKIILEQIESDKLVFFGGGVPLFVGDNLVGGLGISGGTGEEDDDIAQYALSVFEECCK